MEGEEVEAFLVVAIAPNKPKEKNGLEFKKGQTITVERVNKDAATYFGFYGKKEGWFQDYFVKRENGAPEQRKGGKVSRNSALPIYFHQFPSFTYLYFKVKPKAAPAPAKTAPPPAEPKPSKKEVHEQKKADKQAQIEKEKKEKADKKEQKDAMKKQKGEKKGSAKKKSPSGSKSKKVEDTEKIPAIIENTVAYLENPGTPTQLLSCCVLTLLL